jgi:hypothetical protein
MGVPQIMKNERDAMNSASDTKIQFRSAQRSDCRLIASLYSISSDGVADYIWTKLAQPGEDILDVR